MPNSDAKKPSESLADNVLFPCFCGRKDLYMTRFKAYEQVDYKNGLRSKKRVGKYNFMDIDGTYGVMCISCLEVYRPIEAEKACRAYRVYLDYKRESKKRAAWRRFLRIRRKAHKDWPDEPAPDIEGDPIIIDWAKYLTPRE